MSRSKLTKTLCDEYERFLSEQTQAGNNTLHVLRERLSHFPGPDGLTADWFRTRIKAVTPATANQEIGLAKRVLKWRGSETADLQRVKVPREEESVTVEDLYTSEELQAIFEACSHTRDRAMFETLYESAVRASELLSMTIENTTFADDGTATLTVKGKTGTRQVPVLECVPALRTWLDVHPTGKGKVWVALRRPHQPLTYHHLYNLTLQTIQRAGLKRDKKRILHMFRHTRATEYVRFGVRGQSLSRLMGWTKKSNMEAVYVHLSTDDVNDEVRTKVFRMDQEKAPPRPLLSSSVCPRCQTKNDPSARLCSRCNSPLTWEAVSAAQQHREEEIERIVAQRLAEETAPDRLIQRLVSSPETLRMLAVAVAEALASEQRAEKKHRSKGGRTR